MTKATTMTIDMRSAFLLAFRSKLLRTWLRLLSDEIDEDSDSEIYKENNKLKRLFVSVHIPGVEMCVSREVRALKKLYPKWPKIQQCYCSGVFVYVYKILPYTFNMQANLGK